MTGQAFNSRSIADISEPELAATLVADPMFRSILLNAAGAMPESSTLLSVSTHDLGAELAAIGPGDVDLIAFQPGAVDCAFAMELKRIKIQHHSFDTGIPGKLGEVKKAVRQANQLQRMGFHRVALIFLVVTDGRTRIDFNFMFRGASPELLLALEQGIDIADLHTDVGAFRMELVQPLDRDFTLSGGVGMKALQIGHLRSQSRRLTDRLNIYLRTHHGA